MHPSSIISRTIWPALTLLGLALPLAGCDATQQLQAISAGQTGCAPQDIRITDDDPGFNSRSWVAWCNNDRFQCFGTRGSISCKAAPKDAPATTAAIPLTQAPAASWVSHELKACGIVAAFPSMPSEKTQELQTPRGSTEFDLALAEVADGKGEASVACSGVVKRKVSDAVLLDGARDGMLKNIGATLSKERDIIGGREVLFEFEGEQGLAHLLLVHDRLVVATAMPMSAFGPSAAKHFVNSVEAVEAP
jgi:hypothetical protein